MCACPSPQSDLTKETSMNTLKREMAKVIYKEKQQIIDLTKRISMLKARAHAIATLD